MGTGVYKMVDGETIELTEEENNQRIAEDEAAQAEYDAGAWLRDRQRGYASITDQLDQLYWDQINGTTVWRDTITAHKADTPKP